MVSVIEAFGGGAYPEIAFAPRAYPWENWWAHVCRFVRDAEPLNFFRRCLHALPSSLQLRIGLDSASFVVWMGGTTPSLFLCGQRNSRSMVDSQSSGLFLTWKRVFASRICLGLRHSGSSKRGLPISDYPLPERGTWPRSAD